MAHDVFDWTGPDMVWLAISIFCVPFNGPAVVAVKLFEIHDQIRMDVFKNRNERDARDLLHIEEQITSMPPLHYN